jgi:hypothetical protein
MHAIANFSLLLGIIFFYMLPPFYFWKLEVSFSPCSIKSFWHVFHEIMKLAVVWWKKHKSASIAGIAKCSLNQHCINLFQAADYNVATAQQGIVYIDEVDNWQDYQKGSTLLSPFPLPTMYLFIVLNQFLTFQAESLNISRDVSGEDAWGNS